MESLHCMIQNWSTRQALYHSSATVAFHTQMLLEVPNNKNKTEKRENTFLLCESAYKE
jgi:hypothetical protein